MTNYLIPFKTQLLIIELITNCLDIEWGVKKMVVYPKKNFKGSLPDEEFMNVDQVEYFRSKLIAWKESILKESKETIEDMQTDTRNIPDFTDRASEETDRALELRTRDRQRKLISKIDSALRRIEDGTYGFCEETGDPISFKRLDARPIATLSIEAQERHERRERVHRDD